MNEKVQNGNEENNNEIMEPDSDSDQELERQIQEKQHEEIAKNRKEREKKDKKILKYAKAFGENTGLTPDDEEELFDFFKHKKISKVGYVDVEDNDEDGEKSPTIKENKKIYANHREMEENLEKNYEKKLDKASVNKHLKI
jgi:hypothetical protein